MKITQEQWGQIRRRFLSEASERGPHLTLRDRVWATTPDEDWIALPGTSDSPVPDRWWLGCDPEKLRKRRPKGIVLLCQARSGPLHPIGLPASFFQTIETRLSRNTKQVFFNVVRRDERFVLQLRGGEELDVTRYVGDVSWIADGDAGSAEDRRPATQGDLVSETPGRTSTYTPTTAPSETEARSRFFATAKNNALHPLDDVDLEAGSFYLVDVRKVQAVPGTRSLRRILARGGPSDLPTDFAERHDHYGHGASRR